ncbi:MAG: hypothetical protein MJK14_15245, partial [Rivularia sp. ALOHA_DT_140]|nr:hypothetical protein [Rivularia sp. ALOHA_DT_140]
LMVVKLKQYFFPTRYSLLATCYSLLATRYSLLATCYLLLATPLPFEKKLIQQALSTSAKLIA